MSPISINIVGCCYTRESVGYRTGEVYEIRAYIQRIHPLLLFQSPGLNITDSQIKNLGDEAFEHNFNKRMLKTLFDGSATNQLLSRKGDWIIIDTHYGYMPILKIISPDGNITYMQSDFNCYCRDILNQNYPNYKVEQLEARINISQYIEQFIKFIDINWGKNVIIIGERRAEFIDLDNEILKISQPYSYKLESINFSIQLLRCLKCHYIELPLPLISKDYTGVHYADDAHKYLKERIDEVILGKELPNYNFALTKLEFEYKMESNLIKYNILMIEEEEEINRIIHKSENNPHLMELINNQITLGNLNMLSVKAKLLEKTNSKSNLIKAKELYKTSFECGNKWVLDKLLSILWELGDSDSIEEYKQILTSNKKNPLYHKWVGKSYMSGKGFDVNYSRAKEYLSKAIELGLNVHIEYLDCLYLLGEEESHNFLTLANKLASDGDNRAMGRLGNYYYDGTHTPQDLKMALYWYEKAYSSGLPWAKVKINEIKRGIEPEIPGS